MQNSNWRSNWYQTDFKLNPHCILTDPNCLLNTLTYFKLNFKLFKLSSGSSTSVIQFSGVRVRARSSSHTKSKSRRSMRLISFNLFVDHEATSNWFGLGRIFVVHEMIWSGITRSSPVVPHWMLVMLIMSRRWSRSVLVLSRAIPTISYQRKRITVSRWR